MNKFLYILAVAATFLAMPAFSQAPSQTREQMDSITAILPQLQGKKKLMAIDSLITLSNHSQEARHYTRMYLEEARRQKDIDREMWAWLELVGMHYAQFDTDSLFIIGEEAIGFAQKHELYANMFWVRQQFIRRHNATGKILTAFREAEEAYAEAKALKQYMPMAYMLSAISDFYYKSGQFDEAVRYRVEGIETAALDRNPRDFFFLNSYEFLAWMGDYMDRPDEILRCTDSMHVEIERLLKNNPENENNLQLYRFYEHCHRAMAYATMKQPKPALEHIHLAETLYNPQWSNRNKYYGIRLDEIYAEYYLATGDYNKALERLNRALKHYKDTNLESGILIMMKNMALALEGKGDYKIAAGIYSDIIHKKDSINQKNIYKQINELRTIYELDKSEIESARRLAAIRQKNLLIMELFFTCIALAVTVVFVVWSRRRLAAKNSVIVRQIHEMQKQQEIADNRLLEKTDFEESANLPPDKRRNQLCIALRNLMLKDKIYCSPTLSRDMLAKQLGVNKDLLNDLFRSCFGMLYSEYVNVQRLKEAIILLEQSDCPIDEVSDKTGFGTVRSFQRQFQNKYNMSPKNYRKTCLSSRAHIVPTNEIDAGANL